VPASGQRILKQQTLVNSLKREGGERLAEATAFLNSMRDELRVLEDRLDRMVANA
jgi:hypothetical protein